MTASTNLFLAVFKGSKTSPRMQAWMAMPEAERKAKEIEGIAAWKSWVQTHQGAVATMGGPLGKTMKAPRSLLMSSMPPALTFLVLPSGPPMVATAP